MQHAVSLSLELLEDAAESLRFLLTVRNDSTAKLLFPYPEIHQLRFSDTANGEESEWYMHLFVSANWAGFTLRPGEAKAIEYRVRPCTVEALEDDCSDYYRYCVQLPAGEYLVGFQLRVGTDYFCGDSHYNYRDLQREAESEDAVVWTGEKNSNFLHLVRTT